MNHYATIRLCAGLFACCTAGAALAQAYPVKPVRMAVGFTAGSGADIVGRAVAERMAATMEQPVIVENRPGAGGSLATERVAGAPPDGYNILLLTSSAPILSALRGKQLRFDLEKDLSPVSLAVIGPLLLIVHPSVPARNIKELIAIAKSQPDKLTFGSSGVGSSAHLAAEMLASMAKIKLVHVPYKGSGEAVIGVTTGEVAIGFPSAPSALSLMKAGKLRALAITTSQRLAFLPDLPPLNEAGIPGYDFTIWYSVAAPAGTPAAVITRLNEAVVKACNSTDLKELLNRQGLEPKASTPVELGAFVRSEIAKSAKLIQLAGVRAE